MSTPPWPPPARAIYRNNDERGRLKQEINALLKSDITEEKQYSQY